MHIHFTHTYTHAHTQLSTHLKNQDGHQIFKTGIKRYIIISILNYENIICLRIEGLTLGWKTHGPFLFSERRTLK